MQQLNNCVYLNLILVLMIWNKLIPNIETLITPTIDVAFKKQERLGNINLEKAPSSGNGLWQSTVAANAQTSEFILKMIVFTL